jgi:hypothetical protein
VWQRDAEHAETLVYEHKRGGRERRAEVGLARRDGNGRTGAQDLRGLGTVVRSEPLEQTSEALTATFVHDFFV